MRQCAGKSNCRGSFGGTYLLPRILGLGKALELVLTGRMLEAREALEIGLVNKVVAHDRLMDEAREMARMTLKAPPLALQLSKQALHAGVIRASWKPPNSR